VQLRDVQSDCAGARAYFGGRIKKIGALPLYSCGLVKMR